MGMTDRDRQGIRGIRPRKVNTGQLQFHHMRDLRFVCMTHADNRLLHGIGRIFTDGQPRLCWHQHALWCSEDARQEDARTAAGSGQQRRRTLGG